MLNARPLETNVSSRGSARCTARHMRSTAWSSRLDGAANAWVPKRMTVAAVCGAFDYRTPSA